MSANTSADASPFDDGELYDVLCAGLTHDIDFYVRLAREAKGPVLDICCGTGRILLPCLQAGADGDGLDLYEPMLARLRTKATALGLAPTLYRSEMSDFRLPRRYALITITFNAFIHNLTQEAQVRCLERCREHLLPGGLLAFDTAFYGPQIVAAKQGVRDLEGEITDPRTGHRLRMYDTRTFDHVAQTQHSLNEVEVIDAEGKLLHVHRWEFTTRYVYREEMALLLRVAGFAGWEICGDFDRRPLTQPTDSMIVLAWPDARPSASA